MANWTSLPVKQNTREELAALPEKEGRDWDTFLRRELLGEEIDGSPDPVSQEEIIEGLVAGLAEELGGGVTYDDVKTACAAAIREELDL